MFQVIEIMEAAGFLVLAVLLLLVWANVRKGIREVRQLRREILRNQLGVRKAGSSAGVPERAREECGAPEMKRAPEMKSASEMKAAPEMKAVQPEEKGFSLKPAEEQVLREVLAEFLG